MIAKIKAEVIRFFNRKDVQSAGRHALITAGAILFAAVSVGGVHALTVGVVGAAAAAGLRILWLALVAHFKG